MSSYCATKIFKQYSYYLIRLCKSSGFAASVFNSLNSGFSGSMFKQLVLLYVQAFIYSQTSIQYKCVFNLGCVCCPGLKLLELLILWCQQCCSLIIVHSQGQENSDFEISKYNEQMCCSAFSQLQGLCSPYLLSREKRPLTG